LPGENFDPAANIRTLHLQTATTLSISNFAQTVRILLKMRRSGPMRFAASAAPIEMGDDPGSPEIGAWSASASSSIPSTSTEDDMKLINVSLIHQRLHTIQKHGFFIKSAHKVKKTGH
jgi:hypothetical protein